MLNTDDHIYNRKNCESLALKNPRKAIDNADNWAYYVLSFQYDWE